MKEKNCLSLGYEAGGRPSISPKFNFSLYPKYSHYASVLEQNVVKFHQEYNGILPRYVTCDCHIFVTFFMTENLVQFFPISKLWAYAYVIHKLGLNFTSIPMEILPACDCHVFVTFFVTYLGYREKLNQRQSFIFM